MTTATQKMISSMSGFEMVDVMKIDDVELKRGCDDTSADGGTLSVSIASVSDGAACVAGVNCIASCGSEAEYAGSASIAAPNERKGARLRRARRGRRAGGKRGGRMVRRPDEKRGAVAAASCRLAQRAHPAAAHPAPWRPAAASYGGRPALRLPPAPARPSGCRGGQSA
eukprot:6138505-Prymnesium_polylepis.2